MRSGKRGASAPHFPGCQQQLSLQLLLQLQLQLQPQPLFQFPQPQQLFQLPQPQELPQFPQPQELPQFPQPQELPLLLPQQQNRTRMMMIHRQELLFPLLKHISNTSLKDFGIFYAPGFQPEPGH